MFGHLFGQIVVTVTIIFVASIIASVKNVVVKIIVNVQIIVVVQFIVIVKLFRK